MEDGTPAVVADAAGASPAPTGQESQAETVPSPGAQQGSVAPSPGAVPAETPNMRQLREQYESLKSQFEPYKAFGKPEELQPRIKIADSVMESAVAAGVDLGYTEQEIREALTEDPWGAIQLFQKELAEARAAGKQPQIDVKNLVRREVDQATKTYREAEDRRRAQEAANRYDTEAARQIDAIYKDENLSEEERDAVYGVATTLFQQDKEAYKVLREEGKVALVQKYVKEAKDSLDRYYSLRSQRESARTGSGKPAGSQPAKSERVYTLDDFAKGEFDPRMGVFKHP
jgi:hypothetical protein